MLFKKDKQAASTGSEKSLQEKMIEKGGGRCHQRAYGGGTDPGQNQPVQKSSGGGDRPCGGGTRPAAYFFTPTMV